ncbi:hypothetical protein [Jiangella endophytica]|uniref:hypothetical protein n=1 Tax=Jiangella endophytica TaxID=1623398 RepID=UPI000E34E1A8|nr:hypothetical protein [Jiangella endophytica]
MGRVVRIDVRRGIAPLAALIVLGVTFAVLVTETEMWAGRWSALAGYLRILMIVLVPLALAAGAWQGGRERRRRLGELLATTSLPPWRRLTAAWAPVATGVVGGFLLAGGVVAVPVALVATYSGGGWWWLVVVGVIALGAAVAAGLAIGTVLPWRLTAPVLGLAGYVVMGAVTYARDSRVWLSPALDDAAEASVLPLGDHVAQAAWFAAIGATALAVVASRRRWPALVPAAVAVVAGAVLVSGPADRWRDDAAAREPVCAGTEPRVCAGREVAFVLDDFQAYAGRTLTVYAGIEGIPDTVGAVTAYRPALGDDAAVVSVRPYLTWRGTLAPTGEYEADLETDLRYGVLPNRWCYDGEDPREADAVWTAADVAVRWNGTDLVGEVANVMDDDGSIFWFGGVGADPAVAALAERLRALPDAARYDWMERYLVAGEACDPAALDALLDELR